MWQSLTKSWPVKRKSAEHIAISVKSRAIDISSFTPVAGMNLVHDPITSRSICKVGQYKKATIEVSIPGIRNIFDANYSTTFRVVWILALLLSLTGFVYQFTDRLTHYLNNPVAVDVSIQRNVTIRFPSVTLCPGRMPFELREILERILVGEQEKIRKEQEMIRKEQDEIHKGQETMHKEPFGKNFSPNLRQNAAYFLNQTYLKFGFRPWFDERLKTYPFSEIGLDLENVWEMVSINQSDVTIKTPCSTALDINSTLCDENGYADVQVDAQPMTTYWGTCLVLSITYDVAYRGPDTFLMFKITGKAVDPHPKPLGFPRPAFDDQWAKRQPLHFFVHRENVLRRHEAPILAEPILRGYFTTVRFTIREFYFLNKVEAPCHSGTMGDDVKCWDKCVDKYMDHELNCSLPFMHGKTLDPCSNYEETINAYKAAEKIYRMIAQTHCNCPRNCHEMVVSLSPDVLYSTDSYTAMQFYYPDNVIERVTEFYAYGFPALFSDVSAYLSFFFGICALTVLEVVETVVKRARSK